MPGYLIQHYLDNAQEQFASRTAISAPRSEITYQQLSDASNQLANCLLDHRIYRNDRVVFCLEKSPKCIISIMGILKADSIYIPVDKRSPLERFVKLINDCKPSAIICDSKTVSKVIQSIAQTQLRPLVIMLENTSETSKHFENEIVNQEEIDAYPRKQPDYRNRNTDLAYILYTSGSTGTPKGVMISHLNVTDYIEWAVDYFQITSNDKVLSTAPLHFDMSTFDIYCPLKSGGTLVLATEDLLLFPRRLVSLIEEKQVTVWKGVSSLLMYMARAGVLRPGQMPTLKKILFAGEVLPTKYLTEWMHTFPDKEFFNGYGPTETTGMSCCYHVPNIPESPLERIPIGRPRRNTETFVLKDDNSLAGVGEVGELCIRGSGLSPGYWQDPERTNAVFVQNPLPGMGKDLVYRTGDLAFLRADGNIEFVGRQDGQVKWMGYRIELGEIENALLSLEYVKDAAVFLQNGQGSEDSELVAFVEFSDKQNLQHVLGSLQNILPYYMLPKKFVPVDSLPRTDRGKIDRKKLSALL